MGASACLFAQSLPLQEARGSSFLPCLAPDQHLKSLRSLGREVWTQRCFIWEGNSFTQELRTLVLMLLPWPEFLCPGRAVPGVFTHLARETGEAGREAAPQRRLPRGASRSWIPFLLGTLQATMGKGQVVRRGPISRHPGEGNNTSLTYSPNRRRRGCSARSDGKRVPK